MDGLPYQRSITAPTGVNMCACSICLMSHAHDAHGEIDSLADLRDASRERLLTEIGMLRQQNGTAELAAAKREVLASRDAVYGMSAELGELRARLKSEVQHARQEVMQASTWRVGARVLRPIRFAKRLLRKK
jgi:L-ascorbate metabolism protein UlaG (beta-lactamase superfamily)